MIIFETIGRIEIGRKFVGFALEPFLYKGFNTHFFKQPIFFGQAFFCLIWGTISGLKLLRRLITN